MKGVEGEIGGLEGRDPVVGKRCIREESIFNKNNKRIRHVRKTVKNWNLD